MDKTIYLKYPWKTDDIVMGYKYHQKSATMYQSSAIFLLVIGVVFIALGLYDLLISSDYGTGFLIVPGIYFTLMNKINLYFFALNFKKLNYEDKQVEWEISEEKIIHRMINLSESTFDWNLIQGIADTPKGFLLYPQKNMFYWLPKYAFKSEEDIAQFAFLAQDKVKNWQQIK